MEELIRGLPGAELIAPGIERLRQGSADTPEALLVAMASVKLRALGLDLPSLAFEVREPELSLYAMLERERDDGYREYKALRNRLGRFERAFEARMRALSQT